MMETEAEEAGVVRQVHTTNVLVIVKKNFAFVNKSSFQVVPGGTGAKIYLMTVNGDVMLIGKVRTIDVPLMEIVQREIVA